MKKTAVLLFVLVLVAFLLIISVTGVIGDVFGKKWEMISLVAVAVLLAGYLIWDKRNEK
ncbi:MAG: hypothetical protein ACOYJJ_00120 [Anaerovoracaceae bacterium]|jgi:predicted small secreted protein